MCCRIFVCQDSGENGSALGQRRVEEEEDGEEDDDPESKAESIFSLSADDAVGSQPRDGQWTTHVYKGGNYIVIMLI